MECYARARPKDEEILTKLNEARSRAQESKEAADKVSHEATRVKSFDASEKLKKLYREAAKNMHPDLTTDEEQKALRQHWMAKVNEVYEEGNEHRLKELLLEWENSPDSVKGEGVGDELVRTIRKFTQIRRRLNEIDKEINALRKSAIFQLKLKVDVARPSGRDLLREMADELDKQIDTGKRKLLSFLYL